ncbi:hypothetical protein KBK19_09200 [Microvirga sp. STR05]|uniref:Uncharacterized protein n=1 Tax=Hymenobacter duratus TaxID=2771356 RepID=A0ABR8JKZ1_9BACT|nr:hypothetical protein [Hymenobacter duratus]MBD2715209.1 hypothetical protein [Hymenobacter duratus]MBR7950116.1 hypothetical protein [Microvirga sp. STR05]
MKTQFFALLATGLLLFSGCKKDADLLQIDCEEPAAQHALANFWARNGAPVQKFTFTSSTYPPQTTAKGNQLYVGSTSFAYTDGSALSANATIELEFREIETKAEMILSNMPTSSNGMPLESGGEYYFKVTEGNKRLRMTPQGRIYMATAYRSSSTRNSGMQLFFGQNTPNGFNWLLPSSQDVVSGVGPSQDTVTATGTLFQYIFTLNNDSLGWVNCDAFINATPRTPVFITANGTNMTKDNTAMYLVFKRRNSVVSTGILSFGSGLTLQLPNVPVGEEVDAVVLHKFNDKYYFGKQSATVAANQVIAPPIREVTEAELVAEIQQL